MLETAETMAGCYKNDRYKESCERELLGTTLRGKALENLKKNKFKNNCNINDLGYLRKCQIEEFDRNSDRLREFLVEKKDVDLSLSKIHQLCRLQEILTKCVICKDNQSNVLTLPCGHIFMCRMCVSLASSCPVCVEAIYGTVKVIIS